MRNVLLALSLLIVSILLPRNLTAGSATVIDGTLVDQSANRYYLGQYSSGNTLTIKNGGVLLAGYSDIGLGTPGHDNQATVTGTNSLWNTSQWMYLGDDGANNALTVTSGGIVKVGYGIILGSFPTSTGNTLQVVDGGTLFASSLEARRGSILLSNGVMGVSTLIANAAGNPFTFATGLLQTTNGVNISNNVGSFVIGTVTNSQSTWNIWGGDNLVGAPGGLLLGGVSGSTCLLRISGTNTILRVPNLLSCGSNGLSMGQSSVLVQPGAILEANLIAGAADGSGSITNFGGTFQFTSSKPIITNFPFGSIASSNGTVCFRNVTNAPITISGTGLTNIQFFGRRILRLNNSTNESGDAAFQADPTTPYAGLEMVGGTNQWNGTNLTIGPQGTLLISNTAPILLSRGGTLNILRDSSLRYDGDPNNFNAAVSNLNVVISGTNAQWYNQRFFTFGASGGNNLLMITNGGSMITTNGEYYIAHYPVQIGYSASSSSNRVVVTGRNSLWKNDGDVFLGLGGSANELTLLDGGTGFGNCRMGGSQSSNNVMTVIGHGTTWTGGVMVGDYGTGNRLVVSNGASLQVGGMVIGYNPGAVDNSVSINRATVSADQINVGFYGQGSLTLDEGVITVNWFYQKANNFNFRSGVVNAGYSEVNYVVGNGLQAARLNLLGSFHKGSITISSNAYLTGIAAYVVTGYGLGALQNNVTNYGTMVPGNPVGEISILYANLSLQPSSTMIFNIQGTNQGTSYSDLLVGGSAQLSGSLRLRLLNGFKPSPSTVFTLMSFSSASGSFANVTNGSRIKTMDNLGTFQVNISNTNLTLSDYQTTDADGDSIEDAWAIKYFGHTPLTVAELQADADGDGMNNYAEFLANTDPSDVGSLFRISSIRTAPSGDITLQFSAAQDKMYEISYSDDLVSWHSVETPLFRWITPALCEWTDNGTETGTSPSQGRFYRVSLAQ